MTTMKEKNTNQYVRLHRDCLNEHGEVDAIISGGRLFHCPRVKRGLEIITCTTYMAAQFDD